MFSFSALFSVHSALLLSGGVSLTLGAPLLLTPSLAFSLLTCRRLTSKQPSSSEDENAKQQRIILRLAGIAVTSGAIKSLVARPTNNNLFAAHYFDTLLAAFLAFTRVSGAWHKAGLHRKASSALIAACTTVSVFQGIAIAMAGEGDGEA